MKIILYFLFVCFISSQNVTSKDRNNKQFKIVCYWGTWSFYRPGDGKFQVQDIDPKLCTHVIYAFAKLQNNEIAVFDPNLDIGDTDWQKSQVWGHGMYRKFNDLRKSNPHLTTMIGIGGWTEGSDKYSTMASSASSRRVFVKSVLKFLKDHNFDGLDLDWEYPSKQASGDAERKPGRAEDKQHFIALVKELKREFKPYGYVLSSAVSAGKPTIDTGYNVALLSKYLDFINLMTYDFHGSWESKTAHNAPLFPSSGASRAEQEFTVSYAVDYWIKLGANPKKLILGIPLYGRTFTLSSSQNGFGAPASGGGTAGPYTRQAGTLGFNEICTIFRNGGWKNIFDATQKVSYAVNDKQWIGYDNRKTVSKKVKFLLNRNLGGAMVWSLETDDFKGLCGKGKFPLLTKINKVLAKKYGSEKKIRSVGHVNIDQLNSKRTKNDFVCQKRGTFPDRNNKV